ncbi:hypothetical protein B0H14DRAFT_2805086 [Mycena olivaceomarginata]|nr:hypothetical protein B0H14DRAFT_2805086 [Mycena olivaceomarginata]
MLVLELTAVWPPALVSSKVQSTSCSISYAHASCQSVTDTMHRSPCQNSIHFGAPPKIEEIVSTGKPEVMTTHGVNPQHWVRSGKLVGAGEQRHIPPIFAKDIHQMVFLPGVNA